MKSIFFALLLCCILAHVFCVPAATEKLAKKDVVTSNNKSLAQKSMFSSIMAILQQIIQMILQVFGIGRSFGMPNQDDTVIQPAPTFYRRIQYNQQAQH